jgi:5-methyltetrahydrofolate--homocysteine methyltransferase
MSNELVEALAAMQEQAALNLAEKMLNEGQDPLKILDLCRQAVEIVGQRFEAGQYFLPELIMAGEMLKKISKLAEPFLKQNSTVATARLGKVLIGSAEGDIHDIGKDIVTFMLEVNGFAVHDIGVDVPPAEFVAAIRQFEPDVLGVSALLTTAFESIKRTVEAVNAAGLKDRVKIMIGGGTVDEQVRKYAGADAYGADAVAAVSLVKQWMLT